MKLKFGDIAGKAEMIRREHARLAFERNVEHAMRAIGDGIPDRDITRLRGRDALIEAKRRLAK